MRLGICYYCMYGEHKHCYGSAGRTICQCSQKLHDLKGAKASLRMDPDLLPAKFPENPAANDRFFFLPENPNMVTLQ